MSHFSANLNDSFFWMIGHRKIYIGKHFWKNISILGLLFEAKNSETILISANFVQNPLLLLNEIVQLSSVKLLKERFKSSVSCTNVYIQSDPVQIKGLLELVIELKNCLGLFYISNVISLMNRQGSKIGNPKFSLKNVKFEEIQVNHFQLSAVWCYLN